MMESDHSQKKINEAVSGVKRSVHLQSENQSPKYSGHESASYGSGGPGNSNSKSPGKGGY